MTDQPADVGTVDEDTRTVELHREYPDPVDDVWAAFTDSETSAPVLE